MTQLMPLLDAPDVMSVKWSALFFASIFVPILYARALDIRFGMTASQSYGISVVGIVLLLNICVATFVPNMLSLGLFLVAGGSGILLFVDRGFPWHGPLLFLGGVIPIFCAILLIWMDGGSHWDQLHAYPLLPYNLAVFNTPSLVWSPQGADGSLLSEWFLIEQAIAPTLDAAEILLTGQFSGYLNRLFGVGLFVLALSLIWSLPRQTLIARLAITGMLIALIWEQLFVFRPHMTVGLLVVIFWAVLLREFSAQRKWLKLFCLFLTLVLMALAKRDGVVVAVIMSGLLLVEIRNMWIQIILVAGGVVVSLIIGSAAQMAGQSVLSHLISILGNIQFENDIFWGFYAVFISFSAFLLIAKRYIFFLVGLAFAAFIILSTNLMIQSGQFSSGTIDRKIYYMYLPFAISTLLLLSSQIQVGVLVLVATTAFGGIFNETWQAKRRVEGLKVWSDTFRSEIHTLRKLVPNYRDVSLGLLHPSEHMRFVDGPLNSATLFNQPFLQGFFGADLVLSNQPLELLEREVLIIDRSFSAESLAPIAEAGFHFYTHLGGYRIAARDPKFSPNAASLPGLLTSNLIVVDLLEEPQVVLGNAKSEWNLQRWDESRLVVYIRYGDTRGADLTIRQSNICKNLAVAFRFENRNDPSNPNEATVFLDGHPLSMKTEKSGNLITFYWGDALLDALQVRDASSSPEATLELRFAGLEPGSMLSILNPSLAVITETMDSVISEKLRCK